MASKARGPGAELAAPFTVVISVADLNQDLLLFGKVWDIAFWGISPLERTSIFEFNASSKCFKIRKR